MELAGHFKNLFMKKILVTGGAGYIGSHTVVELINSGYIPIIVDNLCNSSIKNINGIEKIVKKNIKFYEIDCTNKNKMNKIFHEEQVIDGVIHFAAFKSVEESIKNPNKYYKNNIGSLEVLLECMNENKVKNIIFSSSCTVYGIPDNLPVNEKAPFKKAKSPYAETKQICEKLLFKDLTNSVSLRYFNPIGSHKSGLIGDYSLNKANNLVPILAETAIGLREQIIIFGDNYDTKDGTCLRDYIHVVDLANAHVKALEYLFKNKGNSVFNLGKGKCISVLEIIKIFEKVNKIKLKYKIGPRREGDIAKIYSDNTLSYEKLKWKTERTLEEAMISTWLWQQKKNIL